MNYLSQWPDLTVMKPDGSRVKASDVLSACPYLVVYIGASWVPDCQKVTPLVIDFFRRQHMDKKFAVLYISRDTTEKEVTNNFLSHVRIPSPPLPAGEPAWYTNRRRSRSTRSSRRASGQSETSESSHAAPTAVPDEKRDEKCDEKPSEGSAVNFLATTDGYYGLPFEWVERVALPLVHHLRVFTYPSVLVLDNTVPIPAARDAQADATRLPHPTTTETAAKALTKALSSSLSTSSSPPSSSSGVAPTPRIERRECAPRVLSTTGRFMLEVLDTKGDNFPWATLDDTMAAGRRLFLTVALVASAVVVTLIAYLMPNFVTGGPPEQARREARRLKREQRG